MDKTFFNFVSHDGEIIEAPIRDAVKYVTDIENKLLSVCDDGEAVFEGIPFTCITWYGLKNWEFQGKSVLSAKGLDSMIRFNRAYQDRVNQNRITRIQFGTIVQGHTIVIM